MTGEDAETNKIITYIFCAFLLLSSFHICIHLYVLGRKFLPCLAGMDKVSAYHYIKGRVMAANEAKNHNFQPLLIRPWPDLSFHTYHIQICTFHFALCWQGKEEQKQRLTFAWTIILFLHFLCFFSMFFLIRTLVKVWVQNLGFALSRGLNLKITSTEGLKMFRDGKVIAKLRLVILWY